MAPVDPEYRNSNLLVATTIAAYASAILISLGLISRTLFHAYYRHPISQRTRSRDPVRRYDILTTAALAVLSFAVNVYHVIDALVTSYGAWAADSEAILPLNIWTASAWFPKTSHTDELRLGRWFRETNWLEEISFAVAGRSRDFWWAQQLSAATVIFSILVAIEARRRNISHAWTFVVLAHLVGLSTAQNLFQIILLMTPLPIERKMRPWQTKLADGKPVTWIPHPVLLLAPFFAAMVSTAAFPYVTESRLVSLFVAVPVAATFAPLVLLGSNIVPKRFGTVHSSVHNAHHASLPVFSTSARASLSLHVILTAAALFFNIPPARSQDPGTLLWSKFLTSTLGTSYDTTVLSRTERARITITRLLGSLSDNPVVRKIGWDVLLSGLSLCVWTGLRNLDTSTILSAAGIPGLSAIRSTAGDLASSATEAAGTALTQLDEATADLRANALERAQDLADTARDTLADNETLQNLRETAQAQFDNASEFTTSAATLAAQRARDAATSLRETADDAIDRYGLSETFDNVTETAAIAARRAAALGSQALEAAGNVAGIDFDVDEAVEDVKGKVDSSTKRASRAATSAASAAAGTAKSATRKAKDVAASAASTATSVAKGASTSPARRRGRPSKASKAQAQEKSILDAELDSESEEDENYRPSGHSLKSRDSGEESEHEEAGVFGDMEEGAESVALAWGLLVMGGLGSAAAGVWGGDVVAR